MGTSELAGYSEYRPCAHSPFPSLAVTLHTEPRTRQKSLTRTYRNAPKPECDSETPKLVNLVRLFHEDVTFEVDLKDDGNTIIIINY